MTPSRLSFHDPRMGPYVPQVEPCAWCGRRIREGDDFCDEECAGAYERAAEREERGDAA